ncbi:hypothetical protein F5X68DRAFT_167231 [Plectosphaerella plurivora]|uniref:NACHT domain-containing protein n=1 Tax=Plectosphaerella plurivora TaxID=936078 RepID=A0A9P8VDT0_9PEZI|nr:hypothetical protein F5X68DRAFT_167231 [Plectosphaerella plurivora]
MSGLEFVGLASNVLQFLEFGFKVSLSAKALYHSASGATVDHDSLETDTVRLITLMEQVQQSRAASRIQAHSSTSSDADKTLWETAASCEQTAKDLVANLDDLKVKSQSRNKFGRAVIQAFKGEFAGERIRSAESRLKKLQSALLASIQVASWNQQSAILAIVEELKAKGYKQDTRFTADLEKLVQEKLLKSQQKSRQQTISDLTGVLDAFAIKATNVRKQQDILSSLYFTTLRERHSGIKDAHEVTLNWIDFDQGENKANFSPWLESPDREIYWVQGKAGSGKSTLMKALVARKETKDRLLHWAGSYPLFIVSHFFWNAGNLMQQSILGLLQTLVYQIFKQCPELIEIACPSRWAASSSHEWVEPWNQEELTSVLEAITNQQVLPSKFCFFIDGLDEYTDGAKRFQGSFTELFGLLRHLASSPSIKVCVSSRPWTVFEEAFGLGKWQLKLQDLTKNDIKLYVEALLGKNPEYQRISLDDADCAEIAPTIVKRADGVWLWVFLVVEQILRGISNQDSYKTLKLRLDSLPYTLDKYFAHMLQSIEPVYWEETNRIFRVMVAAGEALPLLSFSFLPQEMDNPNYAMDMAIASYNSKSLRKINKTERARIKARCHDLLHVSDCSEDWEQTIEYKVDFLHRTVKDFFEKTNILDSISNISTKRPEDNFDPFLSLCRIYLALTKSVSFHDPEHPNPAQVFAFADGLMDNAWNVQIRDDTGFRNRKSATDPLVLEVDRIDSQRRKLEMTFGLLDELDRTNEQLVSSHIGMHWTDFRSRLDGYFGPKKCKTFIAAAIEVGLASYVEEKLRDNAKAIVASKKGRPLLDHALCGIAKFHPPRRSLGVENEPLCIKIVKFLLEQGSADPNEHVEIVDKTRLSPWEHFLGVCFKPGRTSVDTEVAAMRFDAMLLLIRYGADINAHGWVEGVKGVGVLDVARAFEKSPARIERLQQLIDEKWAERQWQRRLFSKIVPSLWGR